MDKRHIIAENLRIERQRKGISQEAMAFFLDVSQAAYSKMERGESPIPSDRLDDIAEFLKISVLRLHPPSHYSTGINLFGLKTAWRRVRNFFRFKK